MEQQFLLNLQQDLGGLILLKDRQDSLLLVQYLVLVPLTQEHIATALTMQNQLTTPIMAHNVLDKYLVRTMVLHITVTDGY